MLAYLLLFFSQVPEENFYVSVPEHKTHTIFSEVELF